MELSRYEVKDMYYGKEGVFAYVVGKENELILDNVPQSLADYYSDDYHCHYVAFNEKKSLKSKLKNYLDILYLSGRSSNPLYWIVKQRKYGLLFSALSKMKVNKDERILELGCGGGDFINRIYSLGFKKVKGIDPFLPDELIKKPIFQKAFITQVEGRYDLIISNHSLEHISNQNEVFLKMRSLLKKGGRVLIRTPISESEALNEYKEYWYQFDAPRHLHIHSVSSLKKLAEQSGFRLEEVVYDSEHVQFSRSELYKRGITIKEFFDKYDGDYLKVFTSFEMDQFKHRARLVNENQKGDQACFYLTAI